MSKCVNDENMEFLFLILCPCCIHWSVGRLVAAVFIAIAVIVWGQMKKTKMQWERKKENYANYRFQEFIFEHFISDSFINFFLQNLHCKILLFFQLHPFFLIEINFTILCIFGFHLENRILIFVQKKSHTHTSECKIMTMIIIVTINCKKSCRLIFFSLYLFVYSVS